MKNLSKVETCDLLHWYDLTEEEQKEEDSNGHDNEDTFFRYSGMVLCLSDFLVSDHDYSWGVMGVSNTSAIAAKVDDKGETVTVGWLL